MPLDDWVNWANAGGLQEATLRRAAAGILLAASNRDPVVAAAAQRALERAASHSRKLARALSQNRKLGAVGGRALALRRLLQVAEVRLRALLAETV